MRIEEISCLIKTIVTQKLQYQKKERSPLLLNLRGLVLMIIAAILFGTFGNVAELLFQTYNIPPQWLAAFRALVGGVILYALLRPPFPRKEHILRLFFYTILGFAGLQIFFYLTIAYTNAPIATLLEFLGTPLMVLYESLGAKQYLSKSKIAAIFLAAIGTAFLSFVDIHGLRLIISPLGLIFGLLAAITTAVYPL